MDAHLWLAQSESIAQRLRDAPHVRWWLPPHAALWKLLVTYAGVVFDPVSA